MRFFAVITTALSLGASVSALTIPSMDDISNTVNGLLEKRATPQQDTDRLLFSTSMPAFLAAKAARNPPNLDWTDNGCSYSPDRPKGYNFLPSCQRHDFGYRNYPAQGRCGDANRKRIDDQWRTDMYNECAKYGANAADCRNTANVYYGVVRVLGGSSFC